MNWQTILKCTNTKNNISHEYNELDLMSGNNISEEDQIKMTLDRILQSNGINTTCSQIIDTRSCLVFIYQISDYSINFGKIKRLEPTIKMYLKTDSVTINYAKETTGFEISIAKQDKSIVTLGDCYKNGKNINKTNVPIGYDLYNNPLIIDIAKLPHLMICGSTGSGKSVCMNTIICSLLLNYTKEQIKFIMIDPKQVELSLYAPLKNYIPYGIISDINQASTLLYNLCCVMDNRYKMISQIGCKNIDEFNIKNFSKFYQIIVCIDELADLMIRNKKEVEPYICRLAQMGRACGIHLILSTQRPSREVVTGLLKVNIPAKICFKVPSKVNSRIVLDQIGAENLSGNGDGLFLNGKTTEPIRFQGCYISTEEINAIVNELK